MNKPISISIALCLGLNGCQVFKKSEAWDTVTQTKPDAVASSQDPETAYAEKVHLALKRKKVEHKIVAYQYRYRTPLREDAIATGTAVIYKDSSNPKYPWWLMDERTGRPVWLPNGSVDKQVAFYLHEKAESVTEKEITSDPDKDLAPAAEARPMSVAELRPSDLRGLSDQNISPMRKSSASPTQFLARAQPRPAAPAVAPAKAAWIRPAQFAPTRPAPVPPVAEAPGIAHANLGDLFESLNGTPFDPMSGLDRRKMFTLKHVWLQEAKNTGTRSF